MGSSPTFRINSLVIPFGSNPSPRKIYDRALCDLTESTIVHILLTATLFGSMPTKVENRT